MRLSSLVRSFGAPRVNAMRVSKVVALQAPSRGLAMRARDTDNMYAGTTNSLLVHHPSTATRREIQDALFNAVGERALRWGDPFFSSLDRALQQSV
jgi:hypothetical protein